MIFNEDTIRKSKDLPRFLSDFMDNKKPRRAKKKIVKKQVPAKPPIEKSDRCLGCPWINPECPGLKSKQCLREWYVKHNPEVLQRLDKSKIDS